MPPLLRCRDVTSMMGAPTTMVFPQRDDDGNLLETQYGRSRFRDQQVGLPSTLPACAVLRGCVKRHV